MTEEKVKEVMVTNHETSPVYEAFMQVLSTAIQAATEVSLRNNSNPDERAYECGAAAALTALKMDIEDITA